MRTLPAGIVLLAAPASAQCLVENTANGVGAVDRDHAIVTNAVGLPTASFYAKTDLGWVSGPSFPLGDFKLFYDSPVAIDGDRAIAGSPESSVQMGRAFVFDLVGTQWTATELLSPTVGYGDFFGWLVAIDGDVAVVGADHWELGGGDGLDRAHVFERDATGWHETAELTVDADSLDVDGTTIVVGDDDTTYGTVYVYERIQGSWTWRARLQGFSSGSTARLGSSVAIDGDVLVAGASLPGAGRVFVYRRVSGGVWGEFQQITESSPGGTDGFGASVALSGSTLLVGTPGRGQGRVYRFEDDGAAFVEVGAIDSPSGDSGFGRSVSVQGQDAVVAGYTYVSFHRLGFESAASFCPTTPNSTGAPATLAVAGCDSFAGERLEFQGTALPAGAPVFVLFGPDAAASRFGDGVRCVGARALRLPSVAADASGAWSQVVDLGERPGSLLTPGRTWNFQAVYRDRGGAGTGLNLTNALAIGLVP